MGNIISIRNCIKEISQSQTIQDETGIFTGRANGKQNASVSEFFQCIFYFQTQLFGVICFKSSL